MKQPKVIKMEQPTTYQVKLQMLGGKRATLEFSDHRLARDVYDTLNNQRVFFNEAIRQIEFNEV